MKQLEQNSKLSAIGKKLNSKAQAIIQI